MRFFEVDSLEEPIDGRPLIEQVDALYMTRIQKEHNNPADEAAFAAIDFERTSSRRELVARMKSYAPILHPFPRDQHFGEIPPEIDDDPAGDVLPPGPQRHVDSRGAAGPHLQRRPPDLAVLPRAVHRSGARRRSRRRASIASDPSVSRRSRDRMLTARHAPPHRRLQPAARHRPRRPRAARDLQGSREALLRFLAAAIDPKERPHTTIVFDAADAPPGLAAHRRLTKGMTVRYASDYDDADALIEELIAANHVPRSLTVVSSDHRMQRAARRRRAPFVDSDVWFADAVRRRERARALRAPRPPSRHAPLAHRPTRSTTGSQSSPMPKRRGTARAGKRKKPSSSTATTAI